MILELCCLCCPALLLIPRPVGADEAALHHLFVPTKNVTDSHWTSKRFSSFQQCQGEVVSSFLHFQLHLKMCQQQFLHLQTHFIFFCCIFRCIENRPKMHFQVLLKQASQQPPSCDVPPSVSRFCLSKLSCKGISSTLLYPVSLLIGG